MGGRDSHHRPRRYWLALALAVALGALPGTAAASRIDKTFGGGDGIAGVPGISFTNAIALQPDGKILIGGSRLLASLATDSVLVRLNRNGTPDTSFGPDHNGRVATPFVDGNDGIDAIAVDSGGRIVVAGFVDTNGPTKSDALVARYKPNGDLDKTFAGDGSRTLDFYNADDSATALAFRGGGRLVVASSGGGPFGHDFWVTGLEGDGTIDDGGPFDLHPGDSFGNPNDSNSPAGSARQNLGSNDTATSMVRQPDGRLVVAGFADTDTSSATNNDFALARFNANGTLDNGLAGDSTPTDTFGQQGKLTFGFESTPASRSDLAFALARQPDGGFIVAGSSSRESPYFYDLAVAHVTAAGANDHRFELPYKSSDVRGAAVQADGKVVLAGSRETADRGSDFATLRIVAGSYVHDGSFAPFSNGVVDTPIAPGTGDDFGRAVATGGGRILVAGNTHPGGDLVGAVVSYNQYDTDDDGVADARDNCPAAKNLAQLDRDHDGKGDACDPTVDGTAAADTLNGTAAAETFCGHGKGDTVNAKGGADTVHGDSCSGAAKPSDGVDKLFGGKGPDKLFGEGGGDTLTGGAAKDSYSGGPGNDTVNAKDGVKEQVDCGKGSGDVANVDQADVVSGCETVHRS
jgi:uncharacterized delta-60 repeat protein